MSRADGLIKDLKFYLPQACMLDWLFRLIEPRPKIEQDGNIHSMVLCKFSFHSEILAAVFWDQNFWWYFGTSWKLKQSMQNLVKSSQTFYFKIAVEKSIPNYSQMIHLLAVGYQHWCSICSPAFVAIADPHAPCCWYIHAASVAGIQVTLVFPPSSLVCTSYRVLSNLTTHISWIS